MGIEEMVEIMEIIMVVIMGLDVVGISLCQVLEKDEL
jgi:hypothetical protein